MITPSPNSVAVKVSARTSTNAGTSDTRMKVLRVWLISNLDPGNSGTGSRISFVTRLCTRAGHRQLALKNPDKSPRQLAWHITDVEGYFISESSVYRILKGFDLVSSPVFMMVSAMELRSLANGLDYCHHSSLLEGYILHCPGGKPKPFKRIQRSSLEIRKPIG